jgi:hypothetical protein
MCAKPSEIDLGFTDKKYPAGIHMCLIFQDEKERRRIVAKFISRGLTDGEEVVYFADVMTREEVVVWLRELEIDISNEIALSNLIVQDTRTAYCPNGKFIPDEMLERLKSFCIQSNGHGYTNVRVSGEMTWALKGIPGSKKLMEYEARVNEVLKTHPITAICQYDAARFSGYWILDALKVHPLMIVRGQIVHSPYYMGPDLFLKEFSDRVENKITSWN